MPFPRSLHLRVGLIVLVLVGVGAGATLAGGNRDGRPYREKRSPHELANLLVENSPAAATRPPAGHHRKRAPVGALRHAAKRRAATPLRSRSGRRAGARAPRLRHGKQPAARRRSAKPAPVHRRRRPSGAAPQAGNVVVGVSYIDPDRITALYARYGAVIQATDGGVQSQAVADYINATGGIRGRKVVLRTFKDDPTDSRPIDVHLQNACSFFADGPRPAAVINSSDRAMSAPCLADKGLTLLTNGPTTASSSGFARYPDTLFAPGSLAMDRFAAPYVSALQGAGFFGRGSRVGLLHWSDSEFDPATDVLRSELDRAGVHIAAEGNVPFVRSSADAGSAVSHVAGVLVRFRLAGVNRVVSVDHSGTLLTIFMLAAEPQGYRPLYGLSTLNSPMFLRASVNPRQLRGAVGIGWMPLVDVPAGPDDDIPPARAQCAEIYRRAGIAVGDRSPYGQFSAYSYCDSLLILRRVLERSRSTTLAAVRGGLEALGSSYTSALSFATRLDGSQHDGVAGYRLLRFNSGCGCFGYEGPVIGLR